MYTSKDRTWVIDVDQSLPDDDLARAQLEKLASAARDRLAETGADQAYVRVGPVPDRTVLLMLAAFAIGPLAPVLLRQGQPRTNAVWAVLGLAALPLWAGMIALWSDVAGWAESGRLPFLLWFGGLGTLTALTFASWSRAVFLAGWDARFFPERMPRLLSNPLVSLALGLGAPGFGLLLHNAPRRAAWALWNGGVTLMATATLWQTRLLWKANGASTTAPLEPRVLEYVLLGALAVAVGGVLVWIGSALDGARCAMHRAGHRAQGRGEWLALAVVFAFVAFAITFQPDGLAREMDRGAARMQRAGMELMPVLGATAASTLDPGQPVYALRLAEAHEKLGHLDRAASIRSGLKQRWNAYQGALQGEAAVHPDNDPWVPFSMPSVTLPGASVSDLRQWSDSVRESLHESLQAPSLPGSTEPAPHEAKAPEATPIPSASEATANDPAASAGT